MKQSKFGVLGVRTEETVNIGDYIQALAAKQFLPYVDSVIQREHLKDYNEEDINMIMNGWYMHHTEQWPPSEKINPLYVAFHLNVKARKNILNNDGIKYLQKHQPIGCRDISTRDVLKEHNIDAYFSGCLTLTLGKTYSNPQKDGKVYFVDPSISFSIRKVGDIISSFMEILKHPISILRLCFKNKKSAKYSIKDKILLPLKMSIFFREYSKFFTKQTLLKAEYICQDAKYIKKDYPSDQDLLNYANSLIDKYAKADFIVTSRIHCALPALGLGTQVIYTYTPDDSEVSKCRFEGIIDLFNLAEWKNQTLDLKFNISKKISSGKDFPINSNKWQILAKDLIETCSDWVKKT